jgi:hypothetical protein
VSSKSKVNFSKLNTKEKEERFHNMSKKIKKLKAQVRSLKIKLEESLTARRHSKAVEQRLKAEGGVC